MTGVKSIDLNLLVVLGAILEERNLTRAGAKLNLSQPTMSGALARLRRHYGDELLVRSGRQYLLSPAAERLLPAAKQALRQVEQTLSIGGVFDPATSTRRFSVAASSHSLVVLSGLLGCVHDRAPGVGIDVWPLTADVLGGSQGLLRHDLLIAPAGTRADGQPEVIGRERFVCILDPANPRLRDGKLSLADLKAMPHAAPRFARAEQDPVGTALERLGVTPNVAVRTASWLPLPFVVPGTEMVAIVPQLLVRRFGAAAHVAVTEVPFGMAELVQAVWWNPLHAADPALTWLRGILREAASGC